MMADRVHDLVGDTQVQLKEKHKDFVACLIAIGESTDITDITQHAAFI
jgi:hypothetical protein